MRAVAALLLLVPLVAGAQAPRPDVKVGDRWTYQRWDYETNQPRGKFEMEVVFAERGVIQVVSTQRSKKGEIDTTYTAEWNAVTTQGRVFNPHTGWLKFPLELGATWPAAYEVIMPKKATNSRNERQVKVVGWEEVVVPAGKFRALKVVSEGHYQRLDMPHASGSARNVIWYVPEIKRWAKLTLEITPIGRGGRPEHSGEELLAYKLK